MTRGRLLVLDERDGQRVATWAIPPGGLDLVTVPAVGRLLVFHGGQVDIREDRSGQLLHTVTIGTVYQYGPAVVLQRTARVFLGSDLRQTVTILDAATGHIVRVVPLPAAPGLAIPDEQGGTVSVPLWGTGGTVVGGAPQPAQEALLDGHSGALLHLGPPQHLYLPSNEQQPADPWNWVPPPLRGLPFLPPPPQLQRRPYALRFPALASGQR